ncbi:MAG: hypothetical protein CM15mP105_1820 [Methanobacteriota archaeon]|nr:MAG: hypothetical protein CM15mP105_1820 [Euryarchaeota archaeon]
MRKLGAPDWGLGEVDGEDGKLPGEGHANRERETKKTFPGNRHYRYVSSPGTSQGMGGGFSMESSKSSRRCFSHYLHERAEFHGLGPGKPDAPDIVPPTENRTI